MNNKQDVKLTMQMSVRDCLNKNTAITDTIPGFSTFFNQFMTNIIKIQNISEQQGNNIKGNSGNKKQLRISLIVQAKDISSKIEAYALNVNNTELSSEIHFTESDLKSLSTHELRDTCQRIYDRAFSNKVALNTYYITDDVLDTYQTTINNFNISIPKPKLGIAERKQLTSQLVSLFSENDNCLISIDKLIEIVRLSQSEFYNIYKNSRKLTNIGVQKLVAKIKIIDKEDNNPIKNVELKLEQVNANDHKSINHDLKPLVRKSAIGGGVNIKHLPEGTYMLTVMKKGFKTQSVIVNITHRETEKVDVIMEKE